MLYWLSTESVLLKIIRTDVMIKIYHYTTRQYYTDYDEGTQKQVQGGRAKSWQKRKNAGSQIPDSCVFLKKKNAKTQKRKNLKVEILAFFEIKKTQKRKNAESEDRDSCVFWNFKNAKTQICSSWRSIFLRFLKLKSEAELIWMD